MKDSLELFANLKRQLTEERETIATRLAAINAVLKNAGLETGLQIRIAVTNVHPTASKRDTGKLTLDQAVLDAFREKGSTHVVGTVTCPRNGITPRA